MSRGLRWLREHADERGGWLVDVRTGPTGTANASNSPVNTAVSAMGLKAFAQAGVDTSNDPMTAKLLARLWADRLLPEDFPKEPLEPVFALWFGNSYLGGLLGGACHHCDHGEKPTKATSAVRAPPAPHSSAAA